MRRLSLRLREGVGRISRERRFRVNTLFARFRGTSTESAGAKGHILFSSVFPCYPQVMEPKCSPKMIRFRWWITIHHPASFQGDVARALSFRELPRPAVNTRPLTRHLPQFLTRFHHHLTINISIMKITIAPILAVLIAVASAVEFKVTTTEGNLECPKGRAKVRNHQQSLQTSRILIPSIER